ncbi:MAG: hypothetical protein IAG13_08910 [Deltaproteobacteria bacterium]|nr:hypothetical protein [Nannocystaceae bacterium]
MGQTFRGLVRNGRLVLDEPSTLPEGTAVELQVVPRSVDGDEDDDLDEDDRARLHEAIDASLVELKHGGGIPADDVMRELRRGDA